MTRTETIAEGVTLILGDCREILPKLKAFDAIVTDPPYGVRDEAWDSMSDLEFAQFSMAWLSLAFPLAPEAFIFGYLDNAVHRLCEMAYPKVRPMIWAKPAGSQLTGASERRRWFAFEAIFHCHSGETWEVVEARDVDVAKMIKTAREAAGLTRGAVEVLLRGKKTGLCYRWEEGACLPSPEDITGLRQTLGLGDDFDAALQAALDRKKSTLVAARALASENAAEKSDVLTYRTVTAGRHPTEKPVALMVDLIDNAAKRLDTILDPFMGSGTTGVAAVQLGRSFTGIERDPTYFDIACKRVSEATKQQDLFIEKPKPMQAKFGDIWDAPFYKTAAE